MNFSVIIGITAVIVVFLTSIATSVPISTILSNWHAFLVVIGSTVAVTMIYFPVQTLFELVKIFIKRIVFKKES